MNSNWKSIATAAISAPVVQAPLAGDHGLAGELQRKLEAGEIAERDMGFARSLLQGYGRYQSFTDKQRPYVERLLGAVAAPVAAPVVSTDKAIADQLAIALSSIAPRDHDFATRLLAGFLKYGSFTDRQRPWAEKFAASATQEAAVAPAPVAAPPARTFPAICATLSLDRFSTFTVGELKLSLKNDGSAIFVKLAGLLAGVIDTGSTAYREIYRDRADQQQTLQKLRAIEADPKGAAAANGILTGRCSCCGRPLTDPESISIGIGPICLAKF